jgi:hypothetical protein
MVSALARGSEPSASVFPAPDPESSPEVSKPSPPPRLSSKVQAWLKRHETKPAPKRARSLREPTAPSPVSSRLRQRGSINLCENDPEDDMVFEGTSPDRTARNLELRLKEKLEFYKRN